MCAMSVTPLFLAVCIITFLNYTFLTAELLICLHVLFATLSVMKLILSVIYVIANGHCITDRTSLLVSTPRNLRTW